jgi:hypothetical protein
LVLVLSLGLAGCTDSQVGSIKAQDGPEANAGTSKEGGRFRENAPISKPGVKPAEEGINSR